MLKIVAFDETVNEDTISAIHSVSNDVRVVAPEQDKLAEELSDAEIFYGYHPPEIFQQATKLRWIQTSAAGVDALLDPSLIQRGLTITNASGIHAPQVAATAWALTLAISRGLPTYFNQQLQHQWKLAEHVDLDGGLVGIVGLGGIGRRYARIAAAMGMRVIAVDNQHPPKPDSVEAVWKFERLNELLELSDVVLVSCPYTSETHHLIDDNRLACMKSTAILINIARGAIVDEAALATALTNKVILAAGIDVCETEPLPSESQLWDVPNLVITPHTGGYSPARNRRLTKFFCENLRRYLAHEPLLNVIDPKKGYPPPNDWMVEP